MSYIIRHKWLYYLIQFTWGLLMNIVGSLVFLVLIVFGKKKPQKFHNCWYIAVGERWGGLELGTFFLIDEDVNPYTMQHEAGHGLQNLIWGPLYPFVIGIPSAFRYHYRNFKFWVGIPVKTFYDEIWFEGQATRWGKKYYKLDK